MGRNLKPLFRDRVSNNWFARFYADGKPYRLSLNTADEAEAYNRFPVVQKVRLSWNQYQKTLSGLNTLVVNAVDGHKITPGIVKTATPENLAKMIADALKAGQANFNIEKSYWVLNALNGVPSDSTAANSAVLAVAPTMTDTLLHGMVSAGTSKCTG